MTQADLQCLLGRVLDSRFKIERVMQSVGGTAFLSAIDLQEGGEKLLRLEEGEGPEADSTFNRFREAAFLQHPNLIGVFGSGRLECEGVPLLYLLTEMPSSDLSETLQDEPISLNGISEMLKQVISALNYLHSENFVYCALRAGSVWRVGDVWKLGDYTQLRVAGKYSPEETRRMMLLPAADVPPEANLGVVTEAWDTWSLGSMLRKSLLRRAEREGLQADPDRPVSLNRVNIPPPFNQILRDSLDPDPAVRASLDDLLGVLAAPPAQEPAKVPVPPARHAAFTPAFTKAASAPGLRPKRTVLSVLTAAVTIVVMALVYSSQVVHSQISQPATRTHSQVIHPIPADVAPSTAPEPPRPSPFGDAPQASTARSENPQTAISSLLTQWQDATRTRDLDRKVACYAPVVDRYYGQHSVPTSRLRAQEENVFSKIGPIRKFEISNLKFHRVGPQWAVVSFDKEWQFGTQKLWSGSAREEVVLRPIRGQWKIASQREVKVYWVNKQAS